MRYCKQRNDFECGPIAMVNALKWAGAKATLKDADDIGYACGTDKYGTYPKYFFKELKKRCRGLFGFSFYLEKKPPIDWFLKQLWQDRFAMIVSHPDWEDPRDDHYSFWVGRTEHFVKTVNYDRIKTVRKLAISNLPELEEIYLLEKK